MIKDQGMCGSCVAFATTALAEFMHMRKYNSNNMTTDLSEQVSQKGGLFWFELHKAHSFSTTHSLQLSVTTFVPYQQQDKQHDVGRPAG